ncbi:hypothetical protein MKW94_020304 [Papaver nudicaule]|uniref:Dirigent protein n=1 Tax=Papaver nudicaule TaxID=74823 RepID=A0AA41UVM1_PAPNU|nr:hypothetical protein [Papaver nudicaule]
MEIFSIFVVVAMVLSLIQLQAQGDNWGDETVSYTIGLEKMTKLHFYFHDNETGDSPTAFKIAEAQGTNSSSTMFGALYMIDNPLTEGPDPNSRLVGRAQGFYGYSGQNEAALMMGMSLVFTANEKFNGSTISVLSQNPFTHTEREFAIVGVLGIFGLHAGLLVLRLIDLQGQMLSSSIIVPSFTHPRFQFRQANRIPVQGTKSFRGPILYLLLLLHMQL